MSHALDVRFLGMARLTIATVTAADTCLCHSLRGSGIGRNRRAHVGPPRWAATTLCVAFELPTRLPRAASRHQSRTLPNMLTALIASPHLGNTSPQPP